MNAKPNRRGPAPDSRAYLPTPEQIAEECRKLQETWDELEFVRRANWHLPSIMSTADPRIGWTAPVYVSSDLTAA